MPDQHTDHIDVTDGAIIDGATGNPMITKEQAEQTREAWTAAHPPIPGLRWVVSFNMYGDVSSRHLEVIPGWESAFAPAAQVKPTSGKKHDVITKASEANRLGALHYQGWFSALPPVVRDSSTSWDDLAEVFREPMRQGAVLVWQHGENAGFHQALLRTLPSAQLGAAGELESLQDFIISMSRLHGGTFGLSAVLGEITRRVNALRREADETAKRVRGGER